MILTQNNIDDNYIPDSKIEQLVIAYDSLNNSQKTIVNQFFSQPENSKRYYDLLQSMMWIYKCPSPEEFLDMRSGFLPVNLIDGLYNYIKKDFIEAMNIEKPFNNIIAYGSTRTGKSVNLRLTMVYATIFVNYLRFPHLYFQLNQMSDLCFYLVSFKATKTNQLLLSPILNILSASDKFHRTNFEHLVKGKPLRDNGVILYTEASKFGGITTNNLTFVTGANPGDFVGGDIICAAVSEINWFKKYAHISDEEVLAVYTKLNDRIKGTAGSVRFPNFIFLDSSANESESPIEKLIQTELRFRENTIYREYIRWEVRPHLYPKWVKENILEGEIISDSSTWKKSWSTIDRPEATFEVCSGDSGTPAMIIKEKSQKMGINKDLIFKAPIDTLHEFEVNLLDAIKDIAGKPSASETKLISDRRIIDNIWDTNLINIEGEIIAGTKNLPEKLIWNQIYRKFFIDRGNGRYQILRAPREPRVIGIDTAHCVDTETEIFTQRGWLKYNELTLKDKVLALDETLSKSVWTDVLSVNIFPEKEREMLEIKGKTHSSLSTMNHRWAVDHYKRGPYEKKFVTSDKLNVCHRIIRSRGLVEGTPIKSKYSDAFVELVAWFWTEGTIYRNKDKSQSYFINIFQSETANPLFCKKITKVLLKEYGKPVEKFTRNGRHFPTKPEWRSIMHKNHTKRTWYLNSYIGKQLISVAPNRVVKRNFILSLTKKQLEIFVQASFEADRSSDRSLGQSSEERLQGLEMALILLGKSVSYRIFKHLNKPKWSDMYYVNTLETSRSKIYKKNMKKIIYNGQVWCPTTKTGTWFARKDGQTYFTGNSSQGCILGIVMAHLEINNEGQIIVVTDFTLAIAPDDSGINLDALNYFILDIVREGNVFVNTVVFDTFQSKQTQQNLVRNNINAITFSVDDSVEPYQFLVGVLHNNMFKSGKNIFLKNNLDSLYRGKDKNDNDRVLKSKGTPVHKYNGNFELSTAGKFEKDVSDATCRAVYILMHNKDMKPVTLYEEENRRLNIKQEVIDNSTEQYLLKKLYGISKKF